MKNMKNTTIKNEIGRTIMILRLDAGKSRDEISLGICSSTVLQRLETGERFADKKLIDALIQRLGKSSDKFEFVLGKREYEINQERNAIDHAFEAKDYDACRELLRQFEEKWKEDNLNWQYIQKMKFLLGDLEYRTIEEAEKLIMNMLCKTSPGLLWEEIEERLLCTEECKLIYLLALTEIEFEHFEKAGKILEKLFVYLEEHFSDVEERIKLYPQVAYSLSMCYEYEEQYEKEAETAKKAIDLLEDNGRIYLLSELLECYHNGLFSEKKMLTKEEECEKIELENQIEVLQQIHQEYGSGTKVRIGPNIISHNYGGQEIKLIHEVLGRKRKIKGMTQEELSKGICEPETLSRLLNGKQIPNQNTYRSLAECLELDSARCSPFLSAEDYKVYEMQRELGMFIQRREYGLAEELFQKIERLLPQNIEKNCQFCILIRTILENRLGRISWEERLKGLECAIKCTVPDYPNISIEHEIFCRQEITILNDIAITYAELGEIEKASKMLEDILKFYQNSEVDITYHAEIIILVAFNYVEYSGSLKNYKVMFKVCDELIKLCINLGRGKFLGSFLYEKVWYSEKVPLYSLEIRQKYCRQAYYLTGLMKEEAYKNIIRKYGETNFESHLFNNDAIN